MLTLPFADLEESKASTRLGALFLVYLFKNKELNIREGDFCILDFIERDAAANLFQILEGILRVLAAIHSLLILCFSPLGEVSSF